MILLEIPNTTKEHFGGMIQFGKDGYLYISRGDGHPHLIREGSDAQDLTTLFGKILRIDVDNPSGGMNYGIPVDNPFTGNTEGYREEILASGLRNPWRFSIDPITNTLWVGDVGEGLFEEIDVIKKGHNYGWDIMEGFHCFEAFACDSTAFEPPVFEYSHEVGCSIIGGYVYRGSLVPEFEGAYIYGDYCSGNIWMLKYEYVSSLIIVPTEFTIQQNYPNPFNLQTSIEYSITREAEASLVVYNLLGEEVVRLVDGEQTVGNHVVIWNASNFASGIYFYRLQAGDFVQTRKMVLLK